MNLWKPLALVSTLSCFALGGAGTIREAAASGIHAQPNMETARARLKEARAALDVAEHDKGGWRAAAITATDKAIAEVDRGIAFAK